MVTNLSLGGKFEIGEGCGGEVLCDKMESKQHVVLLEGKDNVLRPKKIWLTFQ